MKRLTNFVMRLFAFLVPFTLSSLFNNLTPFVPFATALSLVVALFSIMALAFYRKICLSRISKMIILCMLLPVLLSSIPIIGNISRLGGAYLVYLDDKFITRILNYFLMFLIFLFGNLVIASNSDESNKKILKTYLLGIQLLALVGIWQFLNFYYGVPFFDLNTRTHIHGVSGTFQSSFNRRLTSLSNEPSFLAPFLIDGLIICWVLMTEKFRTKIPLFTLTFVLIFSFSGGGYVNASILLMVILFAPGMSSFRHKAKLAWFSLIATPVALFTLRERLTNFFFPFIGRLGNLATLDNFRVYSAVMPLVWISESSYPNFFFGFGPGAYKYASLTKLAPGGRYVHETSNNIFGDLTFEMGIVGLFAILFMFVYLIATTYKGIKHNRYRKGAFLLACHLAVSSMYRADFVSPRFWLVLISIVLLLSIGSNRSGNHATLN